jgi:hypothetical protein
MRDRQAIRALNRGLITRRRRRSFLQWLRALLPRWEFGDMS